MPFPLLAGLGGLIGGIGGAVGGITSGIGGALGGLGLFGSAAAGGKAATTGLLGAGGKFGLGQAVMAGGMGLSLMQAFSGGTSTGGAPSTDIPLSPRAKELQKSVWKKTKEDWEMAEAGQIPANMAAPFIFKMRQEEELRHKETEKVLLGAGARRTGRAMGSNILSAAILAGGQRMEGLTAPAQWRAETRRERFINSVNQLANMMNIEAQAPILHAQSRAARSGYAQMQSAQRGQALGDVARMAGMMVMQGQVV